MKMLSLVPAALIAALAVPAAIAPAAAQTHTRVVVHTDNGHHYSRNHWRHRVVYRNECHNVWRHHQRQRVCERVRVTRG